MFSPTRLAGRRRRPSKRPGGRPARDARLRPVHAAGPVFSSPRLRPPPASPPTSGDGGLTISLCIPARDEAATIGRIVETARRRLMEAVPLLDEILVVDDHSTDGTAEVAARRRRQGGALRRRPPRRRARHRARATPSGSRWRPPPATSWPGSTATSPTSAPGSSPASSARCSPRPSVQFVKGFYRRPGGGVASGGGRVTELVARPLIARLFPHLAGVVQPLAGEYAGRRDGPRGPADRLRLGRGPGPGRRRGGPPRPAGAGPGRPRDPPAPPPAARPALPPGDGHPHHRPPAGRDPGAGGAPASCSSTATTAATTSSSRSGSGRRCGRLAAIAAGDELTA